MATCKLGQGLTDIQGGTGGVYYHRDKSGLHCCSKPRTIQHRSSAQITQRNAFKLARAFSTDPRIVSYNIYRALNGLPMAKPPTDYNIPKM